MKYLYNGILNVLVFFFVTSLFQPILTIGNGTFYERTLFGVAFAVVMYIAPHLLLFIKISLTDISEFIIQATLAALFFFLGYYALNFIEISSPMLDSKIPLLQPINFVDKSIALIVIGILTVLISMIIEAIGKKKKKSYSSSY